MHLSSLQLLSSLLLIAPRTAMATISFLNFPACAQPILTANAPSTCDHGDDTLADAQMTNACLCVDTTFLTNSAQGIYTSCGCEILNFSGTTLITNCALTSTPASMDESAFVMAGDGGGICTVGSSTSSSSGSSGTTQSSTFITSYVPSPTSDSSSQDSSSSTSDDSGDTFSSSTSSLSSSPSGSVAAQTSQTANPGNNNNGGGGLSKKSQILIGVLVPCVSVIIALLAWQCPKRR